MTFSWVAPSISGCENPMQAAPLCYMARQPIMDLRGMVHGYELLFRSGPEALFQGDGDQATRTMIDNSLLFGAEMLTTGLPAFINCTTDSLTGGLVGILPPNLTVLEIHESVEPTAELVAACRQLKSAGFRLALDNFAWKPGIQPLLELADYVKIDTRLTTREELTALWDKLEGLAVARVALRVETQQDYRQLCKQGFTLFQGYYFCRPTLIKNRKIPPNQLSQVAILELLRSEPLDMRKVAAQLKKDAALTYRLLRLVNSPLYPRREKIASIDAALLVVGEDAFRRLALLAITSQFGADQPFELLRMAFLRGRFCEMSAEQLAQDPTEQYLLGLLSLIPAMLRTPISMLTASLPLRQEVIDALKGTHNQEHALLYWLEGLERGDWDACDRVALECGFDQAALVNNYAKAVLWAENALSAAV